MESYDDSKPSKYIIHLDENNLMKLIYSLWWVSWLTRPNINSLKSKFHSWR